MANQSVSSSASVPDHQVMNCKLFICAIVNLKEQVLYLSITRTWRRIDCSWVLTFSHNLGSVLEWTQLLHIFIDIQVQMDRWKSKWKDAGLLVMIASIRVNVCSHRQWTKWTSVVVQSLCVTLMSKMFTILPPHPLPQLQVS